jgi:hypothetical protein
MRVVWASWLVSGAAMAQLVPSSGLRRVDSGFADTGPLAASHRMAPMDLRVPINFEGVYEFQQRGPLGKTETMYARMNSGMTAVFPRSSYVQTEGGLVPQVPAGTVYVLGPPPALPPSKAKPPPAAAVDLTYRPTPDDRTISPAVSRAVEPSTIWTSERLRQARVQTLLDMAREGPR